MYVCVCGCVGERVGEWAVLHHCNQYSKLGVGCQLPALAALLNKDARDVRARETGQGGKRCHGIVYQI